MDSDIFLFTVIFGGLLYTILKGIHTIWKVLTRDVAAKLRKAKKKRDLGLITQSEYDSIVAELRKKSITKSSHEA